jgi:Protein of unknown function (DUF2490)
LLRGFLGISALIAAVIGVGQPLRAQLRQNDVRATGSADLYYAFTPQWTVNLFGEGQLDHDLGRAADFLFRPNLQYNLSTDWTFAAGYVQFQPVAAHFPPERGGFQDVIYHHSWGQLALYNRARVNETFADQSSAMLITAANFIDLRHPLGNPAWFAEIYDEPFFNLKVDGTGRNAGFQLNKTGVGIGYALSPGTVTTLTYEFDVIDFTGTPFTAHVFKFGLVYHLN